jgi:5-methylcytosine-specific restriction enzyme A
VITVKQLWGVALQIPPVEPSSIEKALETFDSTLRATPEWHNWERSAAQRFALLRNGKRYPPKQIVAMATGLPVSQFSGGRQTNEYLRARAFGVELLAKPDATAFVLPRFEIDKVYERWPEINDPFGGSRQSGISTSAQTPAIFLFTGDTGEQYGYRDAFDDAGVFSYTGEGQVGDMQLTKGNRAIVDHARDGRALHVFRSLGKARGQQYVGEFAYANHSVRRGPDREGNERDVIVFHLVPVDQPPVEMSSERAEDTAPPSSPASLAEARKRALAAFAAEVGQGGRDARRTLYRRSDAVKDYVLLRAEGLCESCREPAPFKRRDGTPYLEPHHTTRVSDGGLDHPMFVGAVCPTCHREIHHGVDGVERNAELVAYLSSIEQLD